MDIIKNLLNLSKAQYLVVDGQSTIEKVYGKTLNLDIKTILVLKDDHYVGFIAKGDLKSLLGKNKFVEDCCIKDVNILQAYGKIRDCYNQLRQRKGDVFAVLSNGRLVGALDIVTLMKALGFLRSEDQQESQKNFPYNDHSKESQCLLAQKVMRKRNKGSPYEPEEWQHIYRESA